MPISKKHWLPDIGALGMLALMVAVFFWPVILGRAWIPRGGGDLVSFIFPMYRFASESLSSGEIPFWNPYLYAGAPFMSDNQSGLFYPFNLILYVVNPNFSYKAIEGLVLWHFFFAGASMYACLRGMRPVAPVGRMSALFGAAAFMFSDVFVTHIGNLNLIAVAAWLPLTFLALHRAIDADNGRSRLSWAALGGITLAVATLAGHGQSSFLLASFLGTYAVLRLLLDGNKWAVPLLILVGVIALASAAFVLLPALDSIRFTLRNEFSYARSTEYSLPWQGLLGLATPGFFGRSAADFWGEWSRVEFGYAGVLPWFCAAVAIVLKPSRQNLLFALAGAFFLLLSLGPNAPLYPLAFRWLPVVPFQVPARFVLLLDFCLALLAGFGFDELGKTIATTRRQGRLLRISTLVPLVVLAILFTQYRTLVPLHPAREHQMLASIGSFVVLAAASWILIATRFKGKISRVGFCWAALALLSADLIGLGWHVEVEPNDPTLGFPESSPALEYLKSDPGLHRIDIATDRWQPSLPQIETLYAIGGVFNPLNLSNYTVYIGSMGPRGSALYNLLGVKYLIGDKEVPPDDTEFIVPVYDGDPDVTVYLNTMALPRAMVFHDAEIVADHDAAFVAIHREGFDPRDTLILEGGQPLQQDGGTAQITIIRYDLNHASFEVTTDRAAYFLLTDIDHPHWRAEVNGQEARILTANYAFRAVFLEPGIHRIDLSYVPANWWVGVAISGLTWLVLALLGISFWSYFRKPSQVEFHL